MATVAVFIALGGTSYAAVTITGANVKNESLTSADIKNKSLLSKDFKAGQLPAGASGSNGERGAAGANGAKGDTGAAGSNGAKGDTGAAGSNGAKGDTGPAGPSGGPAGPQGEKGDTGPAGPQGIKGDTGSAGPAGGASVTRFRLSQVVNQPNGQNRVLIRTTGLAPGQYFVTFSLLLATPQRMVCGVQYGGPDSGYGLVVRKMINSGGNPEEFQGNGIMNVFLGTTSAPVLTCNGLSADWSGSAIEVNFIKLDSVTEGTNG